MITLAAPSLVLLAHAATMAVALLVLIPLGVLIAATRTKNWFALHTRILTGAILLILAGMVTSAFVVEVEGGSHFVSSHARVGSWAGAAVVVQPILGVLRPIDSSTWRRSWVRIHRAWAGFSWAIALVAAGLGIVVLIKRDAPPTLLPVSEARASSLASYTHELPLDETNVAVVHWARSEDDASVRWALVAPTTSGYIALGWSPSTVGLMAGGEAVIGVTAGEAAGGRLEVYATTLLAGRLGSRLEDARHGLTNVSLEVADGVATLAFTRPLDRGHVPLTGRAVASLIWAVGDRDGAYHTRRGAALVSLSGATGTAATVAPPNVAGSSCRVSLPTLPELGACYRTSDSGPPSFGDAANAYEHVQELTRDFRLAWSADERSGVLSVLLQARTRGWLALGLMGSELSSGMVHTDVWQARVVDGVAEVRDGWSVSFEPPTSDAALGSGAESGSGAAAGGGAATAGGADDLFDVSGTEDAVRRVTSVRFKRRLRTGDPYDHDVLRWRGGLPVVYSYSPLDSDAWDAPASYHGPARGYARVEFLEPNALSRLLVATLLMVLGAALLVLLGVLGAYARRRYRAGLVAQVALRTQQQQRLDRAIDGARTLSFCMCFMRFDTFAQNGRLVAHEEARDRGQLRLIDSLEDVAAFVMAHPTVFVSHQWLGDSAPDAANVHVSAMVDALTQLCAAHDLAHDTLHVWIEYRRSDPDSILRP